MIQLRVAFLAVQLADRDMEIKPTSWALKREEWKQARLWKHEPKYQVKLDRTGASAVSSKLTLLGTGNLAAGTVFLVYILIWLIPFESDFWLLKASLLLSNFKPGLLL